MSAYLFPGGHRHNGRPIYGGTARRLSSVAEADQEEKVREKNRKYNKKRKPRRKQ